ncbi:hypothetical protein DFS34DRAFT_277906 [Phlyctochytrium arcticum]|nr:hypothetical protein DFS34DRAFT_277906 [Phlyctochytrium arcticum]
MIRFTVLNQPVVKEPTKVSIEVKVEQALDTYNRALVLLKVNKQDDAKGILEDLLASDVLNSLLQQASGAHSSPAHALRYVVHKNYAGILEEEGDWERALEHYEKAGDTDPTDVALWCKIGSISARLQRWGRACQAFTAGLDRADTAVSRFECLDGIVNVGKVSFDSGS